MTNLIDELIRVFEKQIELHQELLTVLSKEKTSIVESNLEALNNANGEKETLILKVKNLEEKRLNLAVKIAESSGESCQDITLKRLCEITGEPHSTRLDDCRSRLISMIKNVRDLNEENKILLTQGVELVRGSFMLLDNLMSSNSVYYRTGEIGNSGQSGRVISGEI